MRKPPNNFYSIFNQNRMVQEQGCQRSLRGREDSNGKDASFRVDRRLWLEGLKLRVLSSSTVWKWLTKIGTFDCLRMAYQTAIKQGVLLSQTWVCSPDAQQSQTTDTGLW